jgi:hypothetical protein
MKKKLMVLDHETLIVPTQKSIVKLVRGDIIAVLSGIFGITRSRTRPSTPHPASRTPAAAGRTGRGVARRVTTVGGGGRVWWAVVWWRMLAGVVAVWRARRGAVSGRCRVTGTGGRGGLFA